MTVRRRVVRAAIRYGVRPVLRPPVPPRAQRAWLTVTTAAGLTASGVRRDAGLLGSRPVEIHTPEGGDPDRAVLYLHGGAFMVGAPRTYRALASHLAAAAGATVYVPDYRLAPEHPYPAGLEDALAAYADLLARGYDPGRLVVAGDSAGGWLALATALRLATTPRRAERPGALALISPWLDLALADRAFLHDADDTVLSRAWLADAAARYAPARDLRDPEFALLAADLTGLPPTFVQAGALEILLSDARRFAAAARAAGVDVDLEVLPGLWHVAHLLAGTVPEATAAVNALGSRLAAQKSGA